ncbi:MAG: hypothetical protein DME07_07230 [Candidatus Rokuibacteriota bacterium]|nr:MAG: hypothetical protein DME07_07230 [Candidatus Rokubacteria bacterium]
MIISAVRSRVRQVLINLIDNGVKYTPAGGRVTVVATFSTDGDDAEAVRLEVTDTGMGSPPATSRMYSTSSIASGPRRRARSPAPALDSPSPRASSRRTEGGSASRAGGGRHHVRRRVAARPDLTRTPITRGRTPRTSRSASVP